MSSLKTTFSLYSNVATSVVHEILTQLSALNIKLISVHNYTRHGI